MDDSQVGVSPSPFSNEIFAMFIESLGEDLRSLRACSLVSSVFRHFCSPILYRDIALDRKEKVDDFIQVGERSDSLQHIKSLSLTYYGFGTKAHLHKPHTILDIISRNASLETLILHRIQFQAEPLTASLLSKLSTVTVLALQDCRFGGFQDFVSFIRCFPLCEVLRLRECTWIHREYAELKFRGLHTYSITPACLEIKDKSMVEWGEERCNQWGIIGMTWLDLTGLKSFTCVVGDGTGSELLLEEISACELLDEITVSFSCLGVWNPAIAQLTPLIARVKLLTLRCTTGFFPWWSPTNNVEFPPSPTLERMRIVSGRFPTIRDCQDLDATFSDTDRYPCLKELEMCSFLETRYGGWERDVRGRLCMDEYLPCLKAMGRLAV